MDGAEGVQFDGLQRQNEWLLGIRTAENRCLDLPFVTPHVPLPFLSTQRDSRPLRFAADHPVYLPAAYLVLTPYGPAAGARPLPG